MSKLTAQKLDIGANTVNSYDEKHPNFNPDLAWPTLTLKEIKPHTDP